MNPATDSAELRALVKAANPAARIMGRAPAADPSELTPVGEQFIVPGCERRRPPGGNLPELDLWDAAGKAAAE